MNDAALPADHTLVRPEPRQGWTLTAAERGWLPDGVIRLGIRRLLRERRDLCRTGGVVATREREAAFIRELSVAPLAIEQHAANAQHYEVPAAFYGLCLGPHRKYSSCFYANADATLGEAEAAALTTTCARAGIADGQRILELGCGWGSLSLWLAKHYPNARITGVSNSASQRAYILATAAERGLHNLEIITADLATWEAPATYDRVVSVECFEHLRNWDELFHRIARWLNPGGSLFFHVFTHAETPYAFDTTGDGNWLGRHFFTGGMMPSDRMPAYLQRDLRLAQHWRWDGTHYARTAEHWLQNLDANRAQARIALAGANPGVDPNVMVQRWRMFFMSCAELWAFDHGQEWLVSHYRMVKP